VKVLYLEHPVPNLLADVLYKGLCEEIGIENVEDHPWKALYHGLTFEGEGSVHSPFSWMPTVEAGSVRGPMSESAICEQIGSFDLVVLASPRVDNVAALQRIIDRVGRGALRRFVIVDGEDYTTVRWDLVERFRPDVYFKLSMVPAPFEVYPDLKARLSGFTKVLPFPLASPTGPREVTEKDIDVAFIGGNYWRPARLRAEGVPWAGRPEAEYKAALDARLRKEFQSYVGSVKEQPIAHSEFMLILNRAKVAVCVGGYGIEPMRTYEILACPDTLLMRERIPVIATHPLVEGDHCMMFDTGDGFDHGEIVEKIRWALAHDEERLKLARNGNALLKEHYLPRARAQQLLGEAF
jgi:Glycosyl transferases group 1